MNALKNIEIEAWLKNGLKIAAVLLTAPATIEVAGSLYPDRWIYQLMAQIAGLALVEGALLLGWYLLDARKDKATPEQRNLYASLAGTAYLVLWIVAVVHGEGLAGIAFRATLGVLLGFSVLDSGILAAITANRAVDKSPENSAKYKRKARGMAIGESVRRRISENKIALLEIKMKEEREVLRLQLEDQHLRSELQNSATINSEDLKRKQHKELQQLKERYSEDKPISNSEPTTPKRGTFPHDFSPVNRDRKTAKEERRRQIRVYASENPEMTPTQLVEWVKRTFGVADSTAWEDYKAVTGAAGGEDIGEIAVSTNGNGNGHHQS